MDTLKLSELIGQKVSDLRFHYIPENEYGLQSFYAFIKLSNDTIIGIPKYSDDNDYLHLTQDNLRYFKRMFDTGSLINEEVKLYFVGQKIVDFYFSYYNGVVDVDNSAFIKLENDYYLSENNSGPVGLTDIDLIIFDEREFTKEVERKKEVDITVRSFIQTKNAC